MSAFRYPSAAALIFLVVGSTCPTLAQVSPEEIEGSHNLGTFSFPEGNTEAELLKRLQNVPFKTIDAKSGLRDQDLDQLKQHPDALMELLRKSGGLTQSQLELMRKNPNLLNDALEKIKRGQSLPNGVRIPSDEINGALKDLQKQASEEPPRPQPNTGDTTPPIASTEPDRGARPPETNNQTGEGNLSPKSSSSTADGQTPVDQGGPRLQFGPKLTGWADHLQSMNPSWRNSPAMQKAVQTLASSVGAEDPKWRNLAEAESKLREHISGWGKAAGLERFWPKGHFELPSPPSLERLPNMANRAIADQIPSDMTLPHLRGPETSANGILTVLAWMVGIVAGAIGLRRIWVQRQESQREMRRKQALLGPWPVDPLAVGTREDLIRAFEYLALSRLGLTVKSWNHLKIAAGLGDSPDPLRRNAALCLTDAYEHARYAPLDQALPLEVIAEARRHLCLLAGVSRS